MCLQAYRTLYQYRQDFTTLESYHVINYVIFRHADHEVNSRNTVEHQVICALECT